MVVNRSAPPGTIVPTLVYEDVDKAIAWLEDAFGFTEHLRWGPEAAPAAQLHAGAGAVFIRGPFIGHGSADHLHFAPPHPDTLSHSVMVAVENVDLHHDRARAHGARILLAPTTYDFGERQYSALDLGGHLWTFTESVADVTPEAWGARSAPI